MLDECLATLRMLGRQAEALLALRRAVTEQQRLLGEYQDAAARIAASAEALQRYADIFHHTEQGVVVSIQSAANVRVLDMLNPAFAHMHGYDTVEELVGKPVRDVFAPDAWDEALASVLQANETGYHAFESVHVRKDGARFPVWIDSTAVKDAHGRLLYRINNVTDITERKKAAEVLAQQEARQWTFVRTVLGSVTGGKLRLCGGPDVLPARLPTLGEPVALSSEALRHVRLRAIEAARAAGLNKERSGDLITGVSEAAMNAVVHAGGGTASVGFDPATGTVQVWVEDGGSGIALDQLPRATLEPGYSIGATAGFGHGFFICCKPWTGCGC